MAEPVVIRIEVNADTKDIDRIIASLAVLKGAGADAGKSLDKMSRGMGDADKSSKKLLSSTNRLAEGMKRVERQGNILTKTFTKFRTMFKDLGSTLEKNRRKADHLTKSLKVFKNVLSGAGKLLAKGMLVNLAALGLALVSVNGAFAIGSFAVKTWHATLKVAAAGAASMVAVLSALAAGQREYAAATNAFRYRTEGGGLTGGLLDASAQLRAVTSNARMAAFGAEALSGAFAAISKNTRVNSTLNAALTALGDFAVVAADPTKALTAGADFLGQLVSTGRINDQMKELAAEVGPEFVRAVDQATRQGMTSSGSFLQALVSGGLSGEVAGQLDLVNRTLFSTAKRNFQLIKEQFADIGQAFLPDFTVAIEEVGRIIDSMLMRTEFSLRHFATGSMVEGLVAATEKVADFSVNLFNKWLPQSEGMFERIGGFLEDMRDWFDEAVEAIRPLQEGGKVLLDVFGPLVKGLVFGFGGGVQALNDTLVNNKEAFYSFGDSLANLGDSIGKLMKEIYDGLVNALPTISRIVDTIASVVDLIASAISGLNDFGGMGALLLGGGLIGMKAGRGGRFGRASGAYGNAASRLSGGRTAMGGAASMAGTIGLTVGAPMALGAQTANQGALGGAMTGASMGAMLGPWGALAGGLGGAALGGIWGMMNQGKAARERARNDAQMLQATGTAQARDLLSVGQVTAAREAFAASSEQFEILIEASQKVKDGDWGGVYNAYDAMKEYTDGLVRAGKVTEEQAKILLDRDAVGEYNEKLKEQYETLQREVNPALNDYDRNVARLASITGETETEIRRLAEALGMDLTGGINTVSGALQQMLGVTVPQTMAEANALARDRMLQFMDELTQPIIERQTLLEAVDQGTIDIGGQVSSGTATEAAFAEYLRTVASYEMATNEDPLVALKNMNLMLGAGGSMYQGESVLAGMEAQFAPMMGMLDDFNVGVIAGEMRNSLEVLAVKAADEGLELNIDTIAERLEQAMQGKTVEEQLGMLDSLRWQQQWWNGNEATLENVLGDLGVNGSAALVDPLNDAGTRLSNSAGFLANAGGRLTTAGTRLAVAATQLARVPAIRPTKDPDGDTPTSRLARTLATHDALSGGIAGSRKVTSGIRNWNLGSINSDHTTGRALDITGQNLGAYATAMNAAGGFAEFHGSAGDRHLHVVPPGDTMSPLPSLTGVSGGTTVNATVNVNGANDPEAVANAVYAKIRRIERTARERS